MQDGWAFIVDTKGVACWLSSRMRFALGLGVDGPNGEQMYVRDLEVDVFSRKPLILLLGMCAFGCFQYSVFLISFLFPVPPIYLFVSVSSLLPSPIMTS